MAMKQDENMKALQGAYERGENIMSRLQKGKSEAEILRQRVRHVEIAYDLQAGSYVQAMQDPAHFERKAAIC